MINGHWLAEPSTIARLTEFTASEIVALRATGPEANFWDPEKIYRLAGDTAIIEAKGLMTRDRDYLAAFFGGGNVTYDDLIGALARAEADPNVKKIDFFLDSPGGQVSGLFTLLDAMKATEKPIRAVGYNTVASAAYAVAAQADQFVLANSAVGVGSIGIAASVTINENEVTITSSNAPDKRPDPSTAEGKQTIREQLDEIEDLFIQSIADGRGVTAEQVRTNYGRGRVFLSAEAVKRGMADAILTTSSNKTANTGGATGEGSTMDLEKLKAEHPAVYAAAVQVGVKQGEASERERVTAHLTLAEGSGDTETALEAIKNGDGLSASVTAKHHAASMRRHETSARVSDNQSTAAVSGAESTAPAKAEASMFDRVADALTADPELGE